jgi:hypothetical protein
MVKLKPSDILFWLLAVLTMALLLSFVLVLAGAIPVESSESAATIEETVSATATIAGEPAPEAATTATTSTRPSETTTQTNPTAPAPQLTNVVITASRGDCWIMARLGSETGELLGEQLLTQGQSVRFRGRRVWLSVGASGNIDVTVNGKPRRLPAGTIETVLGPTV